MSKALRHPRPRSHYRFAAVVMALGMLASCGDLTCIELAGCDVSPVIEQLQGDPSGAAPAPERSVLDLLMSVGE